MVRDFWQRLERVAVSVAVVVAVAVACLEMQSTAAAPPRFPSRRDELWLRSKGFVVVKKSQMCGLKSIMG